MTADILEKDFQAQVVQLAGILGWQVLHVRRSIGHRAGKQAFQTTTSIKGWPDLYMWKPGRVLVAELKREKGRLTAEQSECIRSLIEAGVQCEVWRPSDFDRIKEALS